MLYVTQRQKSFGNVRFQVARWRIYPLRIYSLFFQNSAPLQDVCNPGSLIQTTIVTINWERERQRVVGVFIDGCQPIATKKIAQQRRDRSNRSQSMVSLILTVKWIDSKKWLGSEFTIQWTNSNRRYIHDRLHYSGYDYIQIQYLYRDM